MNPLHDEMEEALTHLEVDPDAKVIVICGAGGNFSAGTSRCFPENEKILWDARRHSVLPTAGAGNCCTTMTSRPSPWSRGYCVGGAFAAVGDRFRNRGGGRHVFLSEVNWGILPGALVGKVVADAVLPRHALYYCCLGDPFDGHEAERVGMINFAVPAAELEARSRNSPKS